MLRRKLIKEFYNLNEILKSDSALVVYKIIHEK